MSDCYNGYIVNNNNMLGKDGELLEGDQILAIDGQVLDANISHQQVKL